MRPSGAYSGLSLAILGLTLLARAAAEEVTVPRLTPLVADVLAAPQAVRGSDGAQHLVYELRIENITDARFTLKRLVVTDASGISLGQLDSQALATRFSLGGRRGSETSVLESSQFGVAFLHVTIPKTAPLPAALTHLIEGYSEKAHRDFSMALARTRVMSAEPLVLGAPLQGKGYVAADGCCDSIRHVRALLVVNGQFYLAQRFAVDWEKVGDDARIYKGDAKSMRSYRIYGDSVYAVADGTVVASRNDLDDQVPGKLPEGLPLDEADGNFAIIELRPGIYALYAHMRKGSVTVSAGARVRRGEQIGNVGNTGNTQAPHLHFQLMDAPSALAANGLPYEFEDYQVTANDPIGTADFDRAEATGERIALRPYKPPIQGKASLPLDLSVVTWSR